MNSFRRHGGRLEAARRIFPAAPAPWIDLSTGINPYPWRGRSPRRDEAARLPDPAETARLESAAAVAFACAPAKVAAVPGADIGLRLLPRLLSARTVAIAAPAYDGHREAWAAAGARVRDIGRDQVTDAGADVLVVINPNNPDGAVVDPGTLLDVAARQRARDGWLIVDESFIETAPGYSVAGTAGPGLIVLRSFGKFYGLPGHRLGFVVADEPVISSVRAVTGDWPVTAGAIAAGTAAYADAGWKKRTYTRLVEDAARLDRLLQDHGFDIVGGTPLFRLAAHPAAERIFLALARAGILARPFAHDRRWLRFGIPAARAWSRLRTALKDCT